MRFFCFYLTRLASSDLCIYVLIFVFNILILTIISLIEILCVVEPRGNLSSYTEQLKLDKDVRHAVNFQNKTA